jgi:hypothetical protein
MTVVDSNTTRRTWPGDTPAVGARIAVRNRYLGTWSPGFEVVAVHRDGCRVKRTSDGAVLPDLIPLTEVREPF